MLFRKMAGVVLGWFLCSGGLARADGPDDSGRPGPFLVGARTVQIEDLNVEVWYPAKPPLDWIQNPKNYDIRQWLPLSEQKKVPDDKVPPQVCACFADLPLDSEHGPYPVILFAHGSAAFRTQTLSLMTQLASRGFVVLAADHPGLYLGDLLLFKLKPKIQADLENIQTALHQLAPAVSFLKDQIDLNRIGLIGHSYGGFAIGGGARWPGVSLIVPMSAGGTQAYPNLQSTLILGGLDDKVVTYKIQQTGYALSPRPKRMVGLKNAGHLAFSDLCALKNQDGDDMVTVAKRYKVTNAIFAGILWDGCAPGQLDPLKARQIVNTAITAAAEDALMGIDRSDSFKNLKTRFGEVGEFKENL